jgi:dethiobiotin synthetase/adenosylmethionine--8-amino-7-oxononanoate aminotransferase
VLYLLRERHAQRVGELQAAAPASAEALWWPFTQHTMVPTEAITVIDSR